MHPCAVTGNNGHLAEVEGGSRRYGGCDFRSREGEGENDRTAWMNTAHTTVCRVDI